MGKKQSANRLYHAIGHIDPELLYDARAYRAPRLRPYLRTVAAAAAALLILCTVLLLVTANTVSSVLTIDTDCGVTLELNADGRVVRATSAAALYKPSAEACSRLEARDAVLRVSEGMAERGGLGTTANTLLFGVSEDKSEYLDGLTEDFDSTAYCVIRVVIDDSDAVRRLAEKRHITVGKATLLLSLQAHKQDVNENRLFRLSANDIALLAQERSLFPAEVAVSGKPLRSGCLATEEVQRIAVNAAGFTPDRVVCRLDADGFKLVYNVMLYEGGRGAAYIIGAATGAIQWEFHGAADDMRESLDKAHEEYGEASDSAPPEQNTPTPAPATANATEGKPTEAPQTSPAVGSTAPPTAKPSPASAAEVKPTERTEKPSEAPAKPTDPPMTSYTYLRAVQWDELPSLDAIQPIETQSDRGQSSASSLDRPCESILIRSRGELDAYSADRPTCAQELAAYQTHDFEKQALITTELQEWYSGEYVNQVFLFRIGDTLYTGVLERAAQYRGYRRDAPQILRKYILVGQDALSGVRRLKTVRLSYEDVFGSALEPYYLPVSSDLLMTNEWCGELPEDVFAANNRVNTDLRLFNSTLLIAYPRNLNTADNKLYDHTAALLRSSDEIKEFKSRVDTAIAGQSFPSETYMKTHALLMTTYVERYNIASYYIGAWKKNGVLYVGFVDETTGGNTRKALKNSTVCLGMIELEKEQICDVGRVEIIHVQMRGSKGSGFIPLAPWDE